MTSLPARPRTLSRLVLLATLMPTAFHNAVRLINQLPLAHRSFVIKCCQARYVPYEDDSDQTLVKMAAALPSLRIHMPDKLHVSSSILYLLRDLAHLIENDVSAAIILDLCRSMELPSFEIEEAISSSWNKEIMCCEGRRRPSVVDWSILFNPHRSGESMIVGQLPPNPKMALAAYSSLRFWKLKMQNRVLFPRAAHKNMSRDTRREYQATTGSNIEEMPVFGQDDWLRFYMETGIQVQGASEMRQRWYPSSAKPRTYYAQGGESYSKSMFMQDVFNHLVESSPITSKHSRLQPHRLFLNPSENLRVYDLESFTSRLEEQVAFVHQLAEFTRDVTVYTVDVREGIIPRNLGEMIAEYNDTCNYYPSVSYERHPGEKDSGRTHITDHGLASMLGIFGNLATATVMHGFLVSQAVDSEDKVNAAGDDGCAAESERNEEDIDCCICHLGRYSKWKTFKVVRGSRGCICLKRPIDIEADRPILQTLCIPPSLSLVFQNVFDLSDPRYRHPYDDVDDNQKISVVGKDMMRFLRSVHRAAWKLSDDQIQIAVDYQHAVMKAADVKFHGMLPNCGDPIFFPALCTVDELRSEDPLDSLLLSRFRGAATVPERGYEEIPSLSTMDVGDSCVCNQSAYLSLLKKLGLVELRKRTRTVFGPEGYYHLRGLFVDFELPYVYDLVVLQNIPGHLVF